MPQPKIARQLNLFSSPPTATTVETPHWQTLPAETRQSLTALMIRLILESADADRDSGPEGARHDR